MSTTIDEKVVSMRFDNGQFESGARTTLGTLGKLKSALNFGKESEGVQETTSKFDALRVAAGVALGNIATRAISVGGILLKALTLDPIIDGFHEYELQINSIQTMLSNTTGESVKTINKYLDELNRYADKTIYNFAEMTRNVGTFTAAGVDLKTSVSAIQGISNLAAASGSNATQASHAMYQLSQALATGTVRLQDWMSIEQSGMGGKKFQEALKQTAREHGIAVDEMIKKNGSFRYSLQEGWLSAEIMTDTLNKFTEKGAKKYTKQMMAAGKMTKEQADAIINEAKAMTQAATNVRTFSSLVSQVRESLGSGWGQTFRILLGDFDEATKLFTRMNNVIKGAIDSSANARNAMLSGWKKLGGRKVLIEGLVNAFNGLVQIVTPIKKAFTNIFPPMTSKRLYEITERFKELTSHFKLTKQQSENLQKTFEGLFSIIKIVINVVKTIISILTMPFKVGAGLSGLLLNITGFFGDFLSHVAQGTSSITSFIEHATANFRTPGFDSLQETLDKIGESLKSAGEKIASAFKAIGGKIGDAFNELTKNGRGFNASDGIINWLTSLAIAVTTLNWASITKLIKDLAKSFKTFGESVEDIGDQLKHFSFKNLMDKLGLEEFKAFAGEVKNVLLAYQTQLKATALMKIAIAIAILAGSFVALSFVDSENLGAALFAMGVLMTELYVFTQKLDGLKTSTLQGSRTITNLIKISISVSILAGALTKIGQLPIQNIMGGLVGLGGIFTEIGLMMLAMNKMGIKKFTKGANQMILLAIAVNLLAQAVKSLGSIPFAQMMQGLLGVASALGLMLAFVAIFQKIEGGANGMVKIAFSIQMIAVGMMTLSQAIATLGAMKPEAMFQGLIGIAGALGSILLFVAAINALNINPGELMAAGASIIGIAIGVQILSGSVGTLGSMKPETMFQGLMGMAVALGIVAAAAKLMSKNLGGAAVLIVAAIGVQMIATALALMSGISAGGMVTALVGLGGALLILAVGLQAISGGIAGAAVLLVASVAIGVLAVSLALLAAVGLPGIITSLIGLAAVLAAFAAAAILLAPALVPMALLSGVLLLFGVALAAVGGGLILVSTGISMLIVSFGAVIAAATRFVATVGGAMAGALAAIGGFVTGGISHLGNAVRGFIQRGAEMMSGLWRAISGGVGKVVGVVSRLGQSMLTPLRNLAHGFLDAGRNAVLGLVNGIANFAHKAIDRAQKLADDIRGRIRKAWDENSPSKASEEDADYYVLGLVNGFDKKGPLAVQAIDRVAYSIRNALSDTLSDDDLNPVITPVLDLTNVSNGVGSLSSMLSDSNYAMTAGLTATSNIQNGLSGMADAINGLKRGLNNQTSARDISINVYGAEGQSASAIAREVRNQFDEIIRLGDMIS